MFSQLKGPDPKKDSWREWKKVSADLFLKDGFVDQLQIFKRNFLNILAWNNQKITAELNDRQRLIDSNFRRAGTGPIQKTYSYNPTAAPKAQELVQKGFKQTKKSV